MNNILRFFSSEPKFSKDDFRSTSQILSSLVAPNVEILIGYDAMEKIIELRDECDIEIAVLGLVDQVNIEGRYVFRVYDVFVPEQECSGQVTIMTKLGRQKLLDEFLEIYPLEKAKELSQKLNFWWHSHVNMGTGPSGQDEIQFREGSEKRNIFFMSIGNKGGDLHCNVKIKISLDNAAFEGHWIEWELRDVPWKPDWESVLVVKDRIHPLMTASGKEEIKLYDFDLPSKIRVVRNQAIVDWAKSQIKEKVLRQHGGRFFSRSSYSTASKTTTVLAADTPFISVDEINTKEYALQFFQTESVYQEQMKAQRERDEAAKQSKLDEVKEATTIETQDGVVPTPETDVTPTKDATQVPEIASTGILGWLKRAIWFIFYDLLWKGLCVFVIWEIICVDVIWGGIKAIGRFLKFVIYGFGLFPWMKRKYFTKKPKEDETQIPSHIDPNRQKGKPLNKSKFRKQG